MDEQCKKCQLVCKRLDSDDKPVRYTFRNLDPEQVIAEIENDIARYSSWHHLDIVQSERSTGNQLAVLLSLSYKPKDEDRFLLLIAQAEQVDNGQTDLYFRYGVPEVCCREQTTGGFSTMVREILESLSETDWLLGRRCRKSS
jgi:hypothetical protein